MKFHKNNFKINFLILKYIFLILENKILKNPRFFNKNFFQFHKNNFKINFLFEKIILLNFRKNINFHGIKISKIYKKIFQ